MGTIRYSDAAAGAMLDGSGGLIGFLNTGAGTATIEFYNLTMPTTGDTALGSQVLLATLTLSDPVEAGASASRAVTLDTITGANAVADGTGTFAILYNANGDRAALVDVGNLTSSAVIKLSSTSFYSGQAVNLSAATISIPTTLSI